MKEKMFRLTVAALAAALFALPGTSAAQSSPYLHSLALTWGTYIGGEKMHRSPLTWADDVAIDEDGNIIVVGSSRAGDLPVKNAFQPELSGGMDAYVAKFDPAGKLVFGTYLGYDEIDYGQDVALDPAGNIYVTGWTFGAFPDTTAMPRPPCDYETQASYVAKFEPDGDLVYSKCIDAERGYAVAGDADGNAYIAGDTDPKTSPATHIGTGGAYDIFVYKLDPTGTTYQYRTMVGGPGVQGAYALRVDDQGSAYVVGTTTSEFFPTVNAVDTEKQGNTDGLAFKLTPDGSALEFSTYIGDGGNQDVEDLEIGDGGSVYLAYADYPDREDDPQAKAVFAHLSADGSEYLSQTDIDGSKPTYVHAVALSEDSVFVAGTATAADLPRRGGLQSRLSGPSDGYIAELDRSNGELVATTYYGGSASDSLYGLDVSADGELVAAGSTVSKDLALVNALQSRLRGKSDAVVFRLSPTGVGETKCSILGTTESDKIFGTVTSDFICAGHGADRVSARDGNDHVIGHKGPDYLKGGSGRDETIGGNGRDRCDAEVERSCER